MTHSNGLGRHSKKISEFIAQTSYQAGDLINIVRNGTNFKIDASLLASFLGVTGTITPVGLGTPVLEQPTATQNNIRGIEGTNGIVVANSPSNGISIKTNLTTDVVGVPVIVDVSADPILFRSITAGAGINVAQAGDTIQITSSVTPLSTKTVTVAEEADFPTPVAGVITLDPLTRYRLVNDVSTANRFVLQDRTSLTGDGGTLSALTYTGSGTMFTWLDAIVTFEFLRLNCPNGTVFEGTSPGNPIGTFIIERVAVDNCLNIGTFGDMFAVRWDNATFLNVTNSGILFIGNISFIVIETSFISQFTGTLLDFGTSTFDGFNLTNSVVITAGSATLLSGLANSGNVNAGGIGTIVNNRSKGTLNIVNIGPDDNLWQFDLNDNIPDTRPSALLSIQGSSTVTTIVSTSTPVLVAGTWTEENTSQFTSDANGRITYTGGKDARLAVMASCSIDMAAGNDKRVGLTLALNGTLIPNTLMIGTAKALDPTSITLPWEILFSTGDFIEVFVSNEENTEDVIIVSASFRTS